MGVLGSGNASPLHGVCGAPAVTMGVPPIPCPHPFGDVPYSGTWGPHVVSQCGALGAWVLSPIWGMLARCLRYTRSLSTWFKNASSRAFPSNGKIDA